MLVFPVTFAVNAPPIVADISPVVFNIVFPVVLNVAFPVVVIVVFPPTVKLTLPVMGAKPGDYFAFLQGRPLQKTESGMTSVGIAAATKLYFTVAPANIFVGIYYRLDSLYKLYSPWSYVISAIVIAALLVVILRRFFSFNIGFSRRKKQNE